MKFYKKLILALQLILVLCCSSILTGCGTDSGVSLEEALRISESGVGVVQEGIENADVDAAEGEVNAGKEKLLYVYVCGFVEEPGVYTLEEDSRVVAAIEAAGGFREEAATEAVNLAAPVTDGMQIVIPSLEEAIAAQVSEERQQAGLVNLNTATAAELCTLRGIGEAKAEAILAYRTEIGNFTSIEQIKNVTGIGESLFNKIKESIYIE